MPIHREQELLKLVELYTAFERCPESRVIRATSRDARFFQRMREGGSCTLETYAYVLQWFSNNWRAGQPWPAEIARPVPGSELPPTKIARPVSADEAAA